MNISFKILSAALIALIMTQNIASAAQRAKDVVAASITLTEADVNALKEIARIQEAAEMAQTILVWAPIVDVFTEGNPLHQQTKVVFSADVASLGQAIINIEKIALMRIEQQCQLMVVRYTKDAKRRKFWKVLYDKYHEIRLKLP